MKYREGAVIGAVKGAKSFLADKRTSLRVDKEADFVRAQAKVDEVLENLLTYGFDQDRSARGFKGEMAKLRQLRADLLSEWFKPIATIARRNLRQVPEYMALQPPKASSRGRAFIASARGMAEAARAHREALISYGLPESFVEDLNGAIDQFEAAIRDRDSYLLRRLAATKGLESEAQEARTVLAVLDGLVRRWAKGDEPVLRLWETSRLIRRRPGPVSSRGTSEVSAGPSATPPDQAPLAIA